jgi:hypothetical protein
MSDILDALQSGMGYVGSALDKPGRAVRGLLSGNLNEGFAALPFSDSLGLTNPSQAVSGSDLLRQAGLSTGDSMADSALGFGAEMALDPTTYMGGFLGRMGGKAAGRGLEAAARMRGPGFATTAEDAMRMVGEHEGGQAAVSWLKSMNPSVFSELPPQSRFLGAGQEAAAFRTPAGDVLRMGLADPDAVGRPVANSVLQATRAAEYPGVNGWRATAERLPMADEVGNLTHWLKGSGEPGLTRMGAMKRAAAEEGLRFHDVHAGNLGIANGQPKIIDPGAVSAEPGFTGGFQQVDQAGRPGLLSRALLDLLGGQPAMRLALDAGRAAPAYESRLGLRGMLAGGSLGATN